jgi:acetolactate synthase-1/2/3 large subunit
MAVDVLPYDHPLRVGMIGTYGNRWANLALGRCDLLLVLGSRLDVRQTGSDTEAFRANRVIYQVDCDAAEINSRVRGCRAIAADLRSFLDQALGSSGAQAFRDRMQWRAEIAELRSAWPDTAEVGDAPGTNPNKLMHQLSVASRKASAYVVDVGNHQMWAAQSLELHGNQRFLTSGGMGAMGFSLPAAVGAALASPGEPVVVIAGDGGFQLNSQELQTVVHHRLPIKIVILNNQSYGMVRQFQQSYFEARYPSTCWGYSAPDFVRVAEAYGIPARSVGSPGELPGAVAELWRDSHTPFLLQVMVDTSTNAYPKLAYGRSVTEMEPLAKPIEMRGT